MPIRVVLADDQQLIRTALRMVIADIEDVEVVGEAADGEEAVARTEELRPDVVVMDIRMPGVDGIEATRRITTGAGESRIVVLTTFDDDDYVYGRCARARRGSWSRTWPWTTSSGPYGSWRSATPSSPPASPAA